MEMVSVLYSAVSLLVGGGIQQFVINWAGQTGDFNKTNPLYSFEHAQTTTTKISLQLTTTIAKGSGQSNMLKWNYLKQNNVS